METEENEQDGFDPTEEEQKEFEELLKQDNLVEALVKKLKNRSCYTFTSESHFAGWLKVNGIIW